MQGLGFATLIESNLDILSNMHRFITFSPASSPSDESQGALLTQRHLQISRYARVGKLINFILTRA